MRKKKIILAVLASLCIAAGAAGVAACTSGNNGSTHDPALYAVYQNYASSTENPMTYEEWLADILDRFYSSPEGSAGEDGDYIETIKKVTVGGKEYYEFTFSSGKMIRIALDGEKVTTTSFTFKAVDQTGDPVADVYFSVGYAVGTTNYYLKTDGSVTPNAAEAAVAKTNENGIAVFHTFPEDTNLDYRVYIANPEAISDEGNVRPVPSGFLDNYFGADELGFPYTSALLAKSIDGNFSITVKFNMSNGWDSGYSAANDLRYKRYVTDYNYPDQIIEEYEPYKKSVAKNRYNYFTLHPYRDIYDMVNPISQQAAAGEYRVYWTADNPDANVVLTLYSFTDGRYYLTKDDGSPADALVSKRSGNNNYVDVTIEFDYAYAAACLSFVADMDCEVTIEVERLGDVTTWEERYVTAEVPAGATNASDQIGRVLEVPLDSVVVKDSNGNYHLDSVTGPMIYVQLTRGTRVNPENSIYALCHYTISDGDGGTITLSAFSAYMTESIDKATNTGVRIYTDYTNALEWYSEHSNSNGLYPVNDQIKVVLEEYCKNMTGWQNYDQYWLAACSYYGPESNGSAEAPYDLNEGENTVTLNAEGQTYVAFRANTSTYYGFYSTDGQLGIDGGIEIDGICYVEIAANQEFVFTVTGNGDTANITISTITALNTIEYSYDSDNDREIGTATNPVTIIGEGLYQVNIDHNMYNGRIAVDLSAYWILAGEYSITVYGGTNAQVVDANLQSVDGKTITLDGDNPARLYVDDVEDGTFFIKITYLG